MHEYIIVTVNNQTIRSEMDNLNGTELVASQPTFICWHWLNPAPADLATAQGLTGYVSIAQLS